jgi:ABC-2 type transport system ATP-binding protein
LSESALKDATAGLQDRGLSLRSIEPSLEDVFIALMQDAQDNFASPATPATSTT